MTQFPFSRRPGATFIDSPQLETVDTSSTATIDDLTKGPVQEVEVKTVPTVMKSVIGSEEFNKELVKTLRDGQAWRSPEGLALKMGCDAVDLAKWMDKVPEIVCKPGKDDKVYYALAGRVLKAEDDRQPRNARPVIEAQDHHLVALLHQTYGNLLSVLQKHSIRIHDKHPEAFTMLMQARDKMSAGTMLLMQATHSDVTKLPRLPEQ
jgi:hypothetical protein